MQEMRPEFIHLSFFKFSTHHLDISNDFSKALFSLGTLENVVMRKIRKKYHVFGIQGQ